MSPILIALLAITGIVLIFLGIHLPRTGRDLVAERLAQFAEQPRNLEELELRQPFSERVLRPLVRQLASLFARYQQAHGRGKGNTQVAAARGMEAIQLKLALAGNPYNWTPADYLGTKIFAAIGLAAVLVFLMSLGGQALYAIVFGVIGGLFGWFAPDLLLRSKTGSRQTVIRRSLPDALDLLVISVEAGLGFDAAIQRMVEKKDNALTREFARVLAEIRVGRTRRDALKDMVVRTQVPDLNTFVGAILQAETLGVSITRVLGVQAEQMRTVRRQRAEEMAAKLQLKLIFPLAIFIFPALCVVIMGPVWPTLAQSNAPAGV